jgi:hypothetical protein
MAMTTRMTLTVMLMLGACAGACGDPIEDEALLAEELGTEQNRDLAAARAATAKYHDVAVAIADGYVADPVCIQSPAGAMGVHYVHPTLAAQAPDLARPAILLYEPTADGPRLVGVEYFQAVIVDGAPYFGTTPPPPTTSPSLFGQTFQGPMKGHGPQMPWHFDLHVWLWKSNPDGMFSIFNPAVSCTP